MSVGMSCVSKMSFTPTVKPWSAPFTFGGLRVNKSCEVLNLDYQTISGLYAAGELVGGIFYFNYPGGTGLTSGSVFGKIAGASAGAAARS